MSTGVGDVYLDLKLNKQPFEKGMSETKATAGRIGAGIGKALAIGIAGAVATAGIAGALIKKTAQLGDTVDKMSQKMGMSSQTYQEWDFIMQRCGASIDSMTVAMKTLASSAETSKDAFAELGISQAEIASMSQEELFSRTITALQGVEDTTKRTYLAGQLLGRGATELGALLNLSAQDTTDLRYRLQELGGVMSQTAVTNSAQFQDALTDVRMTFKGLANSIAESILPIITNAINNYIIPAILKAIGVIRYFISLIGSLFGGISKKTTGLGSAIKNAVGKNTAKMASGTAKAVGGVGKALGGAGKKAKGASKSVRQLKRDLLGFDKINKLSEKDKGVGGGAGGGGGGAGGGGGLDMGGLDMGGASQPLLDFSNITAKLSPALEKLAGPLQKIGGLLKEAGSWLMQNILGPLGKWAKESLLPTALDVLASALEVVYQILQMIGPPLKAMFENVIIPLGKILGSLIILALKNLVAMLKNVASSIKALRKSKVYKSLQKVANIVGKVLKKALSGAKNAIEKILKPTKTFSQHLQSLKKKIAKITKPLSKLKDLWNGMKKKTVTMTTKMKDNFSRSYKDVIKKKWNKVKSKAVELAINIKAVLQKGWNSIVDKLRKSKIKLISSFGKKLPKFAQGGYVARNTPQLAIVGDNKREGEVIAPESKLRAMAQEVANNSTNAQVVTLLSQILSAVNNLDTSVYLDGEAIKDNTVQRINQHTRSTGKLEIII